MTNRAETALKPRCDEEACKTALPRSSSAARVAARQPARWNRAAALEQETPRDRETA